MTPPALLRTRDPIRWWAPFAVGVAVGLAAGVTLGRRRESATPEGGAVRASGTGSPVRDAGGPVDADDARPLRERAWAGAMWGLDQARELMSGSAAPDLVALRRRVAALPGGERVGVRDLGEGIVEVVGSLPDDATARVLLDAVAAEPGVEVVVNRVWTPSSADHNVSGL